MSGLFSHRSGVLYVEHCQIRGSDGQLTFVRADKAVERHWSIPGGSTCVLLLGPGTSLTQAAAHYLAEDGVMVGFTSGGATPLFYASQSEYRPTEYCQRWVQRWADATWRLSVAKLWAKRRAMLVASRARGVEASEPLVAAALAFFDAVDRCDGGDVLLGFEAVFAKQVYACHRARCRASSFARKPQAEDRYNKFIDAGNYMAYGLAASVLWILGIPHAFPVLHGTTRRGALVFDLADVIKDAFLLAEAFDAAVRGETAQQHRMRCTRVLDEERVMALLFEVVKEAIEDPNTERLLSAQ